MFRCGSAGGPLRILSVSMPVRRKQPLGDAHIIAARDDLLVRELMERRLGGGAVDATTPSPQGGLGAASAASGLRLLDGLCRMSERHLTRTGRLIALCLLVAAVVIIGLAISGAFKWGPLPASELASQKWLSGGSSRSPRPL